MGPDVVHALRTFRRRPLFSAVAVGTLALAIGASTAVFSVVDAVLLRTLPFAAAQELVTVWLTVPEQNAPFVEVSYPFLTDVRRDSRTLTGVAAMPAVNSAFLVGGGADTTRVEGRLVTGNFFDVLGARAALGRTFTEAEDRVGVPRVVVVSHGLWQRQLGGDPSAVGRELRVDGTAMTVVGVMPRAFRYPPGADLWTPLVPIHPKLVSDARVGWATILARRAPGQEIAAVRAELDAITANHARQRPDAAPVHPVPRSVVTPLRDTFFGASRPALLVLLLAVLLVLLVASANVAALLLARAGARRREIAVRLALGASRARLVRQLLAESALLAVAGGTAGVALAYAALDALVALVPADVPRLGDAAVDARVLAFSCALTLLSATVAGLVPALLASRPALTEALGAGARDAGPGLHRGWRSLLLGAEAAIAVVLLSGAALLVQTFSNLQRLDLGFDPQHVLTFEVTSPRGKYDKVAERRALYGGIVDRLAALPGAESAAAVLIRPLWGRVGLDWPFIVEGQASAEAEKNPPLNLQVVTPQFFGTMRMPLVAGRTFSDRDTAGTPPVVVISEPMARRYWPGQDPLGKRLQMPAPTAPYPQIWVSVVGVVAEARYRELQTARYDLYMSYLQSDEPLKHFVVRTERDPLALAGAAREAVRAVDAELVLSHVTSMEALVDGAMAGTRFAMHLLSGFALVALALAALGTYGVVAFLVGRRTREIGLRMALGARAGNVVRLVLRQGMVPVAAGALLGVAGAFALGRALSALLYGVSAQDLTAPVTAAALLATAGLLACALPARRAARVDPASALRED
jgi:putative ABC transport system permease protein